MFDQEVSTNTDRGQAGDVYRQNQKPVPLNRDGTHSIYSYGMRKSRQGRTLCPETHTQPTELLYNHQSMLRGIFLSFYPEAVVVAHHRPSQFLHQIQLLPPGNQGLHVNQLNHSRSQYVRNVQILLFRRPRRLPRPHPLLIPPNLQQLCQCDQFRSCQTIRLFGLLVKHQLSTRLPYLQPQLQLPCRIRRVQLMRLFCQRHHLPTWY